jgi:3'-5' exonuclease
MKPKKEQLFYFDAEWVPVVQDYFNLRMDYPLLADAFDHQTDKWNAKRKEDGLPEISEMNRWWDEKAHFYPEFCKIICVSYGYFNKGEFSIKSLYGKDEAKVLAPIPELFDKVNSLGYYLCGAAIQRYDMPWLSKRLMANKMAPPKNLNVYGKKPWEVEVFDLMQVWGQGNLQESFTPLELIAASLNVESSKNDLSGSKVAESFWKGEIIKIKDYCEEDVRCTMECAVKIIELL